jgi:hypothetical protein
MPLSSHPQHQRLGVRQLTQAIPRHVSRTFVRMVLCFAVLMSLVGIDCGLQLLVLLLVLSRTTVVLWFAASGENFC